MDEILLYGAHGIIASSPPLLQLRVCAAYASVLTHRTLRTLNLAKPQRMRFCCNKAPSYELLYAIAEKLNCSAYSLLPAESSNSGKYFSEEIMHLLQSANSYQQNMIISYIEWYLTQPLPSAVKEHE